MKRIKILALSLMLVSALFTGCGSSNKSAENNVETTEATITPLTEATTESPTEVPTEPPTEAPTLITPIDDSDGDFFKVRACMSCEDIIGLFGEPHEGSTDDFYVYYVKSVIPELNILDELKDEPCVSEYCFSFSSGGALYSWEMDVNYFYFESVYDYVNNTLITDFKDDYPELEERGYSDHSYSDPTYGDIKSVTFMWDQDFGGYKSFYIHFTYSLFDSSLSFTDNRYWNSSGNYDKNDSYYKNNDSDNDGYIDDKEFQNAVGDWMDDHGY